MDFSDSEIIPIVGDFSFIINETIRNYLTVDYNFLQKFGKQELSSYMRSNKDLNALFWKIVRLGGYKYHTDETFRTSIYMLEYITFNGWTEFVINCLNKMPK